MLGSSAPYDIARPTGLCAATGAALAVGDRFVAVLVEQPGDEALGRLDYTAQAWAGGARPEAPLRLFGFWNAVVPEPSAKPSPLIDDEALLDLFDQLGAATGESQVGFRYLLALILIRKRLLVYEGGSAPDRGVGKQGTLLVRPKGVARPPEGPALMVVVDPGMDDEQIERATEQLGRVMNLDAPEPGDERNNA